MFKCSCADSVINLNICKHIHSVCNYFLKGTEDPLPNMYDETSEISNLMPETSLNIPKENNSMITTKLEILLGLNSRTVLDASNTLYVQKSLDKLIDIYNNSTKINIKPIEQVNVQQKIEPQIRFSSKNKKREVTYPSTSTKEEEMIQSMLKVTDGSVPNIHTCFDHTYTNTI
ncbi:hypothetical protein PPYR_00017 [Photinus pyralis]|uniref:SWIM-type domain-containing protein n=1 Tax=Photinus pyralis TaxID=7054 RepID=A0A5N4B0B8_PHOPY|nr:hypothetical protein PPYR_00017 [Photinus pyralis]